MTERAKKTGYAMRVLGATLLLVPAFGAGVLVGRSLLDRRPPAKEKGADPASDPSLRRDRRALAACREELAARSEPRATASAAEAPPGEERQDTPERAATVDELEVELKRCRKSEILVDAELCIAAARQFKALLALPKDGLMCGPKSRSADLIEKNFESCAALSDVPADLRSNDLTKEESSLIADAIRVRETLTEDDLLRSLKEFVWTCTETPPKLPPMPKQAPKPQGD
ncbi:hypothetical protein WMF45_12395 [Sorangium sp. So ce448]|uniref:hypothetical protein n=1 Tax=Sorangium sp. So ce448 TaxID=3133314 RepID=UPI003F628DD3